MRRFSSEGSLLEIDALPRTRSSLKGDTYNKEDEVDISLPVPQPGDDTYRVAVSLPSTPAAQDSGKAAARPGRELTKELSFSVENLTELDKSSGCLKVNSLNESFKAYSDSQLAPGAIGSTESVGREDLPIQSPSASSSASPLSNHAGSQHHRDIVRSKLSSAKLHLKILFGQSPNSSHTNLAATEHREPESSDKERRSRLPFLKQWSQVGHSKAQLSKEELEKWAESLDTLLENRVGVSVFGAFLRSEFCEENLQFYLACEQYRHSSNTFSLHRRAKEINATYIQPGAPREVNLDSKTRDLTLQLLKAPSHNSLCHAQRRIRALLDTDCYPRFLHSNIYLQLLSEAQ